MSKAQSSRWIVVPPCSDFDFWQSALIEQAAAKGLSLTQAGFQSPDTDLIITHDATLALSLAAQPEDVVAIISRAGPLPAGLEGQDPNPHRHNLIQHASEMTRRVYEGLAGRIYYAEQIARGPVALFDDLILHKPDALTKGTSRRNAALVEAMGIYQQDDITWSTDVLDILGTELEVGSHSRSFDTTGKPRFMAHGPYLMMPAGQWKVVYRLEFSELLCDKNYRLDWGGIETYSELVFQPTKPGLYEIEMDWTWETPAPCEMRLVVMEGIFDGTLTFHDIRLSRLA